MGCSGSSRRAGTLRMVVGCRSQSGRRLVGTWRPRTRSSLRRKVDGTGVTWYTSDTTFTSRSGACNVPSFVELRSLMQDLLSERHHRTRGEVLVAVFVHRTPNPHAMSRSRTLDFSRAVFHSLSCSLHMQKTCMWLKSQWSVVFAKTFVFTLGAAWHPVHLL